VAAGVSGNQNYGVVQLRSSSLLRKGARRAERQGEAPAELRAWAKRWDAWVRLLVAAGVSGNQNYGVVQLRNSSLLRKGARRAERQGEAPAELRAWAKRWDAWVRLLVAAGVPGNQNYGVVQLRNSSLLRKGARRAERQGEAPAELRAWAKRWDAWVRLLVAADRAGGEDWGVVQLRDCRSAGTSPTGRGADLWGLRFLCCCLLESPAAYAARETLSSPRDPAGWREIRVGDVARGQASHRWARGVRLDGWNGRFVAAGVARKENYGVVQLRNCRSARTSPTGRGADLCGRRFSYRPLPERWVPCGPHSTLGLTGARGERGREWGGDHLDGSWPPGLRGRSLKSAIPIGQLGGSGRRGSGRRGGGRGRG